MMYDTITVPEIEEAIGRQLVPFVDEGGIDRLGFGFHNCHSASLAIVQSGVLGEPCRVARGSCRGVIGQHSWIVMGSDPYAEKARILDSTLWSYDEAPHLWRGTNLKRHTPHGYGYIFTWGKPSSGGGDPIELEVSDPGAKAFLKMVGPLDFRGWHGLLSQAPVLGWPAGPIFEAASKNEKISALIPIDKLGMLTDLNPNGLYQ